MATFANRLGLVIRVDPDTVFVWVKGYRDELKKTLGRYDRVKIGDWVSCTVNGGKLQLINNWKGAKVPVKNHPTTPERAEVTFEIVTDVTFSSGSTATSELLGDVSMAPRAQWPQNGTYKCTIVSIPYHERAKHRTFWMVAPMDQDDSRSRHPSMASRASSASVRSGDDSIQALVVHVNENANPAFLASAWFPGQNSGGHIAVVTDRTIGNLKNLRRGTWIRCHVVPYENPGLPSVRNEVKKFHTTGTNELPLVNSEKETIRVETSCVVRNLQNGDCERFAILQGVPLLGDVGVSLDCWYNRDQIRYRIGGSITAQFAFAHQDIGLGVYWYLVEVLREDDRPRNHVHIRDLHERFSRHPTYPFLLGNSPVQMDLNDMHDRHPSMASLASNVSMRSGDNSIHALVVHVNRHPNPAFLASAWFSGKDNGGHIAVVTERTIGNLKNLRRGIWIRCIVVPYEDPDLPSVQYEVKKFHTGVTDELPSVNNKKEMILARSSFTADDLLKNECERFAILPDVPFFGDVGVSLNCWYDRNDLLYRRGGTLIAVLAFARQDIGLGVYWYLSAVLRVGRQPQKSIHISSRDWHERFSHHPKHEFLLDSPRRASRTIVENRPVPPEDEQPRNLHIAEHDRLITNCRSFADLKEFLDMRKDDIHSLAPDSSLLIEKDVKLTKMCSFESAVFAYSPRLGWCAANVYGRTEHDEWSNVGDGEWVSADLILAHSQNGRQPIVEWLVCPNIKPTVPLFNLPCKKPNTSFAVMEALAFNNVVTAEDHRGRRFIVLDTQLGEVRVPVDMTGPDAERGDFTIQCPENCCPSNRPTAGEFRAPSERNASVQAPPPSGRRASSLYSGGSNFDWNEGSQSDANRSEISSQNQEETDNKNEVPYGYPVNDATPLNEVAFSRDSPQGRGDRPVNSASSSERFSASPKISRKKSQDSLASGNQGYNLSEAFERELNPPTSSDEEPSMTSARHKQWQASILAKKTGNAASLKPPTPTAEPLRTGPPSVHSDARSTRGASISSGHANMQEAPKCGMAEAVASADQSSIVVTDEYDDDEEVMTQYGEVHGNEPQRPALNYEFSD